MSQEAKLPISQTTKSAQFTGINWQTLRLSIGVYISDFLEGIERLADSPGGEAGISLVQSLFAQEQMDPAKWRHAATLLARLCSSHPNSLDESGGWYDGSAGLLAMAAAMEVAESMVQKLTGADQETVDGKAFKAFKYVLRAYRSAPPECSSACLQWVENMLHLRQGPSDGHA